MRYARFFERIDGCARIATGDIQESKGSVDLVDQDRV
jgi:hypothetical protein